jgi:hypothetical protein
MRILCISNSENSNVPGKVNITIGKWYESMGITDRSEYYILEDDEGFVTLYAKYNFITLQDLRDKRLNDIGV